MKIFKSKGKNDLKVTKIQIKKNSNAKKSLVWFKTNYTLIVKN